MSVWSLEVSDDAASSLPSSVILEKTPIRHLRLFADFPLLYLSCSILFYYFSQTPLVACDQRHSRNENNLQEYYVPRRPGRKVSDHGVPGSKPDSIEDPP
ncbi:hypothetical protein AVEN_66541-1 [Araneus ventricosus]|uniref:Uncharacterized protein n=1 Tax=Araneus ventricosus TaxID=182803 RepID=A0A4Y2EB58_ARAVE|nr:hypothetical protein AVEN_66541-1 [Araneus ventricosus]